MGAEQHNLFPALALTSLPRECWARRSRKEARGETPDVEQSEVPSICLPTSSWTRNISRNRRVLVYRRLAAAQDLADIDEDTARDGGALPVAALQVKTSSTTFACAFIAGELGIMRFRLPEGGLYIRVKIPHLSAYVQGARCHLLSQSQEKLGYPSSVIRWATCLQLTGVLEELPEEMTLGTLVTRRKHDACRLP